MTYIRYSAWHTKDDIKALRREEIETYIVDSQKTFYYWSGHQVKKPHQQMGDFVAGCCAALNPEKWIETHASTAAEGELSPEKARGQGDSDAYSNKKRLKKRKRGSDNGTKPELEAGGRGGIVEEVVLQSLAKKQRYKPQTQTDDGGTAAANGMTQSEEEPKTENDKLAGTTVLTTDTKTDSRSSKIPRDPEAFAVWFWRNRLQRVFCSNTLPKSEVPVPSLLSRFAPYTSNQDMPLLDMLFTKIEVYEEMNVECLRSSRIQKVMHSIAKLPDQKAPRDGEFQFRARALALVQKWQVMLDNSDAEKDRMARRSGSTRVRKTGV
jgi:hypothetical protein